MCLLLETSLLCSRMHNFASMGLPHDIYMYPVRFPTCSSAPTSELVRAAVRRTRAGVRTSKKERLALLQLHKSKQASEN